MANHYKVSLKEEKETLLITLQAKAIDSHSKNSILNDKQADEMIRWLECIPSDQPVMIIAEGLLEYFSEDEVKMLLHRLTSYFPYGQIAFDVMNSFAVKSGKDRLKESTGAVHKWAVDDIQEVDRLESKLHRIKCLSVFDSTYMEKLPLRVRFPYSILRRIPRFKNMMRILLYKFESGDIRL